MEFHSKSPKYSIPAQQVDSSDPLGYIHVTGRSLVAYCPHSSQGYSPSSSRSVIKASPWDPTIHPGMRHIGDLTDECLVILQHSIIQYIHSDGARD